MPIRKHLFQSLLLLPALALCSCGIDLGVFEKGDGYADYYASFGDMKGLYDGGDESYDIQKSIFNAKTVQNMSWEDEDDAVKEEEYVYVILPFETGLSLDTIALYIKSPVSVKAEISAFYFIDEEEAPQKIKYLTSPDTEPVYDDDGNQVGEKEIEYDDPLVENSLVSGGISLVKEEWTSFVLSNFHQQGYEDGNLHTGDGGLLYIRMENNSGWNKDRLDPVKFTFINLIIRGV